ncbi:MAG: GWxTD domain-containing protein [bacterium]|jgi:GWxTD domain-containing protein
MMKLSVWLWAAGLAVSLQTAPAVAQKKANDAGKQRETIAKPLSEKERRKREERLRKELEGPFRQWLEQDVTYIITDEERQAFRRLNTDDEREQFIEQFWLRRDPTPDTIENEYREEHYRRIAYANERFASGIPGWKTDRGRIYITFGPPDEVDSRPSGGIYDRPMEEGGGSTSVYPFEKWRYRYIEGIGTNIEIEFVDTTMTGEYRMTMDPSEKDALTRVPGAGLTLYEQLGLTSKNDRFNRTDGTLLGVGDQPLSSRMSQFERLEQFAKLQRPPAIKFKDLEAAVDSRITYNLLPIKVQADYIRMTNSTVLAFITVQLDNKDLQFQDNGGVSKAVVNIYGRITSMTRRVVNVFEEPVAIEIPTPMLGEAANRRSIYNKAVFLQPGSYRLNIVAKDVVGGTMNNYEMALHVPRYEDEKLAASSLMLADLIEKVPTRNIGSGQFVIGDTKVRPRIDSSFKRNEKMGIYAQFYNFVPDEKTQRPNGEISYQVVKNGSNEQVFEFKEELKDLPGASAQQVTVEKVLPLAKLEPGQYTLKMTVVDRNSNQTLTPSAVFSVN